MRCVLVPLLFATVAHGGEPTVICQDAFNNDLECRRMDGRGPTVTEVPAGWVLEVTDIIPVVTNQGNLFVNGGANPIILRVAPGPIRLETPLLVQAGESMTWNGSSITLLGRIRRVP